MGNSNTVVFVYLGLDNGCPSLLFRPIREVTAVHLISHDFPERIVIVVLYIV